jgi:hypothetical protein
MPEEIVGIRFSRSIPTFPSMLTKWSDVRMDEYWTPIFNSLEIGNLEPRRFLHQFG